MNKTHLPSMANHTVCFSGHRSYIATPESEARLFHALAAACNDGYTTFISGMAPGFDLAAAEAVVRLRERAGDDSAAGAVVGTTSATAGLRLIAAVPFTGQARKYSPVDLARYEALLAAADEVHVLADRYSHGCYLRRDDWMVERSGRIICWYGLSKRSSGTRYTVRRAVARGLEIVNIFRDPAGTLF